MKKIFTLSTLCLFSLVSLLSCSKEEVCKESAWYADNDADGLGNSSDTKMACEEPEGYVNNSTDEDDADPLSNCDATEYYADADGDMFGSSEESMRACSQPEGYVENSADPDDSDNTINISNIDKALAVLDGLETPIDAINYVSAQTYIQHNHRYPNGREILEPIIGSAQTLRIFEAGDYVIMHNKYGSTIAFDLFRFEEGLIVEHWDNLTKAGSDDDGTNQTDGTKTPAIDLEITQENQALMETMTQELFINGDWTNASAYFDFANFIEHKHEAGSDGSYFSAFDGQSDLNFYSSIEYIHTSGNFSLVMSEGSDISGNDASGKYAYFDLFRIENGKMIEHWEVVELIAPESEWKNSNGKW